MTPILFKPEELGDRKLAAIVNTRFVARLARLSTLLGWEWEEVAAKYEEVERKNNQ